MKAKFKLGDTTKLKANTAGSYDTYFERSEDPTPQITIVSDVKTTSSQNYYECMFINGKQTGVWEKDLQEVTKTLKNMTLIEKIKLARKGEPEKTFINAGITTLDGSFTPEGQSAFLEYLLFINGDAFKKDVVDGILKDIGAEKK